MRRDLCRNHGVSDATFYKGRARFGGMDVSDAKTLEAENAMLKKLLAEQMMDASTLKDMLGNNVSGPVRGEDLWIGP